MVTKKLKRTIPSNHKRDEGISLANRLDLEDIIVIDDRAFSILLICFNSYIIVFQSNKSILSLIGILSKERDDIKLTTEGYFTKLHFIFFTVKRSAPLKS